LKLKDDKEWNSEDIEPGVPVDDEETMYGMIFSPSNKAEEAFPAGVVRDPDIMSTRSDSIIGLAA
jgi:hypothetical protein